MLDLSADVFFAAIPVAVLGASLLGSGHCVAMCGGLLLTVARDRPSVIRYHLGRLLGYAAVGALAGFLGSEIAGPRSNSLISGVSSGVLAAGFVLIGARVWMGKPLHFFSLPKGFWVFFSRFGAGMTGLLSAFLPCGWLHVFILGALASGSAQAGALSLFFFWLGTLPALSFTPLLARKALDPLMRASPKLSAIVLVMIGLGTLGIRILPQRAIAAHGTHRQSQECPMHHPSEP